MFIKSYLKLTVFTTVVLLLLLALPAAAVVESERPKPLQMSDLPKAWDRFRAMYRAEGYPTPEESNVRYEAFVKNFRAAVAASAANPHATFGYNSHMDWTEEELAKLRGFKPDASFNHEVDQKAVKALREKLAPLTAKVRKAKSPDPKNLSSPGNVINWAAEGHVTSVKDQGRCQCCWAFSAIANAECQNSIHGTGLISLSEQEIVSCYAQNCNGGYVQNAWNWALLKHNGGFASYASFPYTSGDLMIPACPALTAVQYIRTYQNLNPGESELVSDVWIVGPISVCLYASEAWNSYSGGVMEDCPQQASNHCVLVVGYNLGANPPYWIIKNSWGENWGSGGYLYLQYGGNLCSISNYPCTSLAL